MNKLVLTISLFSLLPFAHIKSKNGNNLTATKVIIKNVKESDHSKKLSINKSLDSEESSTKKPLSKKEIGRQTRIRDLNKVGNHLKKHKYKYLAGYFLATTIIVMMPALAVGYNLIVYGYI